jgi:SAM-dependent methyltransferase
MILDGEQGAFMPPLYQEHDFGVLMNAGDLYVRQALTPGELLTVGMARGRVLELGAGSARVSRHLRDLGLKVVASDADPDLVAMYKSRGWSDARQITLPDIQASLGKFDTVIALRGVLSLAGELDLVLRSIRQIKRLLNPGGRLIFTSSRVNALLLLPGRSPLEYRVRFIYRGCRSPWLRATAIPEWLAIPLLKEEGFVTVETVDSSTSEGAGYYAFATASG